MKQIEFGQEIEPSTDWKYPDDGDDAKFLRNEDGTVCIQVHDYNEAHAITLTVEQVRTLKEWL